VAIWLPRPSFRSCRESKFGGEVDISCAGVAYYEIYWPDYRRIKEPAGDLLYFENATQSYNMNLEPVFTLRCTLIRTERNRNFDRP